ncbi:aminoglycoside phosphotransferase family protein [Companilactobacillus mishanensis]|uniref:Aminoglycoside phosphotransferase family protein n=1 Tax=Companilactobacillus mishanensis TaxID=2486008 RepID=A0ABW9P882_9LACO|nr:aminoglycoside phosphotransferase family protein [Companilactobacillus mishanensis]MQS45419.1 aminoglycoside phosphotransferase family protein [Companilactobacillus mishanensis]
MTESMIDNISDYLNDKQILESIGFADLKSVSFLAQGEYNRNYLIEDTSGEKLVFRINYGSQINVQKQARYEYDALKILEPSEHTPVAYYLDDSQQDFPMDILIEQYLPGRPLDYQRDLKMAAEIFASIHNLDMSQNDISKLKIEQSICSDRIKEAEQLLQPVANTDKLEPEEIKILFDLKNWCEKNNADEYFKSQPLCLVNTEVNSGNFLITDDYGWLIDWEKPVISSYVQDLSQFMVETTTLFRTTETLSKEQVDLFLNRYCNLTKKSIDEVKQSLKLYMPFMLLRALSWCGMLVATYDEKPIQNEDILHVSQSFLEPDFAIPLLKKYGVTV